MQEIVPTSMHSVRLEPTGLILIGTWTTYQATGGVMYTLFYERRWLESSRSRGGVIGRATIPTTPFRACVSVFPRTSLPTRVSLWVGRTAAGSTTVSSRATAGGARDHSGLPPPSPSFARPPCPWRPGPSSHPTFGTVSSPARRQLVKPGRPTRVGAG